MKKVIVAAIASAFAFGSLSSFAAPASHAPARTAVVKHDQVKKVAFVKVRHAKRHHRHHRRHYR